MAANASLIVRPEHCPLIIAIAHQIGKTASVPLYRAAAKGLVRVVQLGRGTRVRYGVLNGARGPGTVVVVGDDDYATTGPSGWRQAASLLRWARVIILHGASAEPDHYAMAADGAMARRRALLVETSSAHLGAWMELTGSVARPEAQVCVVGMAPGLVHPRRSAPPGATLQ